jgi:hypothetical protein
MLYEERSRHERLDLSLDFAKLAEFLLESFTKLFYDSANWRMCLI